MSIFTVDRLDSILAEVRDTLIRKNAAYGDAWEKHGGVGVLVRISDKSLRLENINGKEALMKDESPRDTFIDLIGYGILGLMDEDYSEASMKIVFGVTYSSMQKMESQIHHVFEDFGQYHSKKALCGVTMYGRPSDLLGGSELCQNCRRIFKSKTGTDIEGEPKYVS